MIEGLLALVSIYLFWFIGLWHSDVGGDSLTKWWTEDNPGLGAAVLTFWTVFLIVASAGV